MSDYYWLACDLQSGKIRDELPDVSASGLRTLIGAYTTASVEVPIPTLPTTWDISTEPRRTMLVCVRSFDDTIVWGGFVTSRSGGASEKLTLGLTSLEGYFDRRYQGSQTFTQRDEGEIASWLATSVGTTANQGPGLVIDSPNTGTLRDRTYDANSDRTVYTALTELQGVQGGPEWTIALDWSSDRLSIVKTFVLRKKLGVQSATPNGVFDFPGTVKDYVFSEDHTTGNAANYIQTFGDGDAANRAASDVSQDAVSLNQGVPRYELRETESGVTDKATLNVHAADLLATIGSGTTALTLTCDLATAPAYRREWFLGDTVALAVSQSYRHPSGAYITGRVVGFDFDPTPGGSLSPIVSLGA